MGYDDRIVDPLERLIGRSLPDADLLRRLDAIATGAGRRPGDSGPLQFLPCSGLRGVRAPARTRSG